MSALGEDNPLANPLVSALKVAKSKLEAPIGERLDSCQRFLERARKRVTSAESANAEAVVERDRLVAELAEGEKRMERLREEARAAPPTKGCCWRRIPRRCGAGASGNSGIAAVSGPVPCVSIERRRGSMSKAAAKLSQLEERELQEVGQRSDRFAPY